MRRVHFILAAVLLGIVLATGACSGRKDKPAASAPSVSAASLQYRALEGEMLSKALDEIRSELCPPGLDPQVFESLRARLLSAVESGRTASEPPDPSFNIIDDLEITDLGGGTFELSWSYRNRGDYDLNSEVNIADLTPIGLHLGKSGSDPQWQTAQRADGDGNGEINIADVTPVGLHYGAQAGSFHLYGALSAAGPWTYIDALPFSSADFTGYPPHFNWQLSTLPDYNYYRIAPADFEGYDVLDAETNAALYSPGSTNQLTQIEFGSAGGSYDGPAATPLEGVRIEVPEGAFPSDTTMILSEDGGTVSPAAGVWEGEIFDIHTAFTEPLEEPLTITLPYTGGPDYIPVPFYIDDSGALDACTITAWDPVAGTVSFESWHTSRFTILKAARQAVLPPSCSTSWQPGDDGFQVINAVTSYTGGNCWGMSCFSRWYWDTYSRSGAEPDLYPEFMQPLDGQPAQQIIATRAQLSLLRVAAHYNAVYLNNVDPLLEELDTILIMRFQLVNTRRPIVVHLVSDDKKAVHAVLAFAYGQGAFRIYDPNTPNITKQIEFNELGFEPYINFYNFTGIRFFGTGSLQTDSFDAILADAKSGFQAGQVPLDVDIRRPGGTSAARVAEVDCTIGASAVPVDSMRLTAVDETGSVISMQVYPNVPDIFNFTVPLHRGENRLWLETYTRKANGQFAKVFNSLENKAQIVNCTDPPLTIQATLTWDGPDNRDYLHLVLIDPAGEVCWQDRSNTPDGATLYLRNESSGRVESIELGGNDQIRWGKAYRLRVFNPDIRPYNFTLSVSLNEGPATTYTGSAVNFDGDWASWYPPDVATDTGPWWWEGPTVIPQQP